MDWTSAERRELRGRGAVEREQWLVRSPDRRLKLSFSVRRQLLMQQEAMVGALLQGARRSLAGMPQRHLPPAEAGVQAWVLQQDWLIVDLTDWVRSARISPAQSRTRSSPRPSHQEAPSGGPFLSRRSKLLATPTARPKSQSTGPRTSKQSHVANCVVAEFASKSGHEVDEGWHDTSPAVSRPARHLEPGTVVSGARTLDCRQLQRGG